MPNAAALAGGVARLYGRMRPVGAGAILCLHSVVEGPLDPGSPHVSPATLRMVIAAARRAGTIVPLRELLARHRTGRSTRGMIAITFDDAYAALISATEFLRAEQIPFTIFVTTGASDHGRVFWWDRFDELQTRVGAARWRALEQACGLPEAFRLGQPAEYGPWRPLRQWVLHHSQGRLTQALDDALTQLEQEVGFRTTQRAMTFEELAALARDPGVEVGVHTVTHPVLPLLDDEELHFEIESSYSVLRERFAGTVPVLAAPYGLFDRRTIDIARQAGMEATLTVAGRTLAGASGADASIPRICVCAGETDVKMTLRLTGLMERYHRWRDGPPLAFPTLPSATT